VLRSFLQHEKQFTLRGFDLSTHIYRTPSLALKLGHTLKACANTAINCAMQTHGDEDTLKTFHFICCCSAGRGVAVCRDYYFMIGDFLLKYRGKITDKEQDLENDSYVFEFRHRNKRLW